MLRPVPIRTLCLLAAPDFPAENQAHQRTVFIRDVVKNAADKQNAEINEEIKPKSDSRNWNHFNRNNCVLIE